MSRNHGIEMLIADTSMVGWFLPLNWLLWERGARTITTGNKRDPKRSGIVPYHVLVDRRS